MTNKGCHCPAHIIIGRAIQLLNRSAAKPPALCPTASDSLLDWISACRRG
ncbi:hypothetical protein [Candidatus Spongiihabitans sp.]